MKSSEVEIVVIFCNNTILYAVIFSVNNLVFVIKMKFLKKKLSKLLKLTFMVMIQYQQ